MKLLLRGLLGVLLLVLLVVGAALLALPRLLDDEAVRERIQQAARDSLGRELRYERLELGLLPPSLRALGTRLSGEREQDPPLLEAREIALRVALLPLLARSVVVDSLVVQGATLRLTRTRDGIALPAPKSDPDTAPAPEADGATAQAPDADDEPAGGLALAVRRIELRDSIVQLADRSVRPPVDWEIRELDAELRGQALDAPIDLELDATLASGGRVRLAGRADAGGRLDLKIQLDELGLSPLASYLGSDPDELAGSLSGTATLVGPSDALEQLDAQLSARDVRLRRDDLSLQGPLELQLSVSQPSGDADGHFELDLTGAQLEMSGTFVKPPGTPGSVSGRIVAARGGGFAFEDVKLVIKNFEARGRVGSLDPLRVELSAEPFELRGWEELVPALSDASPGGRLGLSGLRYTAEPASLQGDVELLDVSVKTGSTPLQLSGRLRAQGDRLTSEGLRARTADQTLDVDARIEGLFSSPRYQLHMRTQDADSNALAGALLSKPDTLFGPLGLDASLRGGLGEDALRSLDGRIDFDILNGRLKGVSLLRAVTERFGSLGNLALDLGEAFGGRDLQRFYGDEFELFSGVLDVADGIARTDDLRLVYRGYTASLRGTLALSDLALDMQGDLTLDPEIDRELAEELELGEDYEPRSRMIPLAAVGGTLDAPSVRLDDRAVVQIAAAYASDRYGGRLREQLQEELGEGSGVLVEQGLDILQGVLGGQRREAPPPPPAPQDPASAELPQDPAAEPAPQDPAGDTPPLP